MESDKVATPIPQPPKQVSKWDKYVSKTLKSIRISYMNWTYLPRSNGDKETIPQRLLRYSHFPMATQVFVYFAYRAACQNLYGRFFIYSTGIQYFLQDLNYTHSPLYRVDDPTKQMLMQLGEAVILGGISTAICTRIHKAPHRSWKYYLASTSTVMVPSVIGLWWSRRDHLIHGNSIFSQNGALLDRSKKAGLEANVTVPLGLISLFEKKNMVFFTPLKGIIFTELAIICSCLLSPVAMGLISPIGTIKEDVPYIQENEKDDNGPSEITIKKEDVLYFRGYFCICSIHEINERMFSDS